MVKRCINYLEQDNRTVEINIENHLIESIIGERELPHRWKSSYFNPSSSADDSMEFFVRSFPELGFKLVYEHGLYRAAATNPVLDETVSTKSTNAGRALFTLAAKLYLQSLGGSDSGSTGSP